MTNRYKGMILLNALLGFLFVALNLVYDYFGNMPSHHALWSPLWLTFYNYNPMADDVGVQELNFSFYFFWVLMIVSVYFLFRLQRSKETKQNPSQNAPPPSSQETLTN